MDKKINWLVVVLCLIWFSGCTPAPARQQPQPQDSAVIPSHSKPVNNTAQVKQFVSPDKKYTVFIGDEGLFVGQGNDFEKAQKMNLGRDVYREISWSPDSQYFFAGSNGSRGIIMRPQDRFAGWSVNDYESGPFWSPDGDKVGFTVNNRLWREGGSEETTDILIKKLDNETLGGVRFVRGTLNYYYKMEGWDQDGKIRYSKYAKADDKLIGQFASEFGHHIYALDPETQEKQEIALIKDLEYLYFKPSPDRKWLSMVKLTFSGGEAEGGIPRFYNMETGQIIDLQEEYNSWDWDARWFSDSSRMMLDERTVYDLTNNKKITFEYPEDIVLLGGQPSPDGSKLAVLFCKRVQRTGSEGEPVHILIFDNEGRKLASLDTPLIPHFSNNMQSPLPVKFTWLGDNQNLIVESWEQPEYSKASLWKVNTADGSVTQFVEDGQEPLISPDGQKIFSLTREYSEKRIVTRTVLNVQALDGTVSNQLSVKANENFSHLSKIIWGDNSDLMVFLANKEVDGIYEPFLIWWDLKTDKIREIAVESTVEPLYVQDGKIVCIDGYVYQ